MRSTLFLAASFLTFLFGFNAAPVQARSTFNRSVASANANDSANDPTTSASTAKVVLAGKITNPAGPLPGAVVILTGTKQMAVTNANGEFEFEIPANAGTLDALVTYAGYADEKMTLNATADESTVSLTNARVIVVSRKQQLKRYLKTAHKQVKRELRQVRK